MSTNEAMNLNKSEFKFLLNGNEDLRAQLEEFKKICDAHEKHRHRHCKKRYYQLGLMARIVCETTDEELRSLLNNGTRTFLFDLATNKLKNLENMISRTKNAIEEFQSQEIKMRFAISLAFEIHGDCCRLGRLRNDCSILVNRGEVVTLTLDEAYKWCGVKEIIYVINLQYYLDRLKLCDAIKIGNEVVGRVAKRFKSSIGLLIEFPGLISSFEYIELPDQCYIRATEEFTDMFKADLEFAKKNDGNYIVMPNIRCRPFLRVLRRHIETEYNVFKLIGSIDLEYITTKMLDILGIVKCLDCVWIPDVFNASRSMQQYIYKEFIPLVKCQKKPIIGTVPLQRCSEFKRFENHEFLWKIDTIFIEKSSWCFKYPLIVKKLLPIRDFHYGVLNDAVPVKNLLTSYKSIVNFIIRTISSVECQAIFLYSRCDAAAEALSGVEIYCPVYVMLPLDTFDGSDLEEKKKFDLARELNLRRNTRAILYTTTMNECSYTPIDYGIDFARKNGYIETGDFIITVEVCKDDSEKIQLGGVDNVVILRAYYVPPLQFTEKFLFA